jgi:hypothetical protein
VKGGEGGEDPWELVVSFALGLGLLYAIGWLLLVANAILWAFDRGGLMGALALWLINN